MAATLGLTLVLAGAGKTHPPQPSARANHVSAGNTGLTAGQSRVHLGMSWMAGLR
jgi:hypothetical protein